MAISKYLSMQISERIRQVSLSLDENTEAAIKFLLDTGALPLYFDIGGVYALKPSGEILVSSWADESVVTDENDQRIKNIVLFQGSKKYPEILELIDDNPNITVPCPHCNGTGIVPLSPEVKGENFVCYCGGLGWIPKISAA